VSAVAVLAADDQPFFLGVARDVVRATPGFCWAGEAQSGEDAIEAVVKLHPDLVLLDVRMPGIGGIEAARRIVGEHPGVVVVLITVDDDRAGIELDIEASGAAELIGKQRFGPAMLRALWARHGSGG
jgi:two-component system, NarL family, invasion response regulator UvrY